MTVTPVLSLSPGHPQTPSLSVDAPVLGVSCKWSHTLGGLVCLSFPEHRVLRVPALGGECQRRVIFHGVAGPHSADLLFTR